MSSRACSNRHKGLPDNRKRFANEDEKSHQPRRCKSPGGPSGKSNNGGKAPTYERVVEGTGLKARHHKGAPPANLRPHHGRI